MSTMQRHLAVLCRNQRREKLYATFAIDTRLAGFAFRAAINVFVLVFAAAAAAGVAFLMIALQPYKAASADPAQALRYV